MKRIIPLPKIEPILFTQDGYDKIVDEQQQLLLERVGALEHLKKSRELGDLKENGYYQASRQKMNAIDSRLRRIKFLLKYGEIRTSTQTESVEIGSTVVLLSNKGEVTYQIVGGEESNPSEGKISHKSPLGRELIGKKAGEIAVFHAPIGDISYTVSSIS